MRKSVIIAAMAAAFWTGEPTNLAVAQAANVHVLVSNGIRAVIEELRPQAERVIGHPLTLEFNSSSALRKKIEAGDAFDVAILTSDVLEDLTKAGKIASGSGAGIARSGIGVGIRAGAHKPDIRTAAAVKQTLLNAKSFTFAQDGASRVYIVKMLDRFGIADQVKSKIVLEQGSTRAAARVADGSAELILTLVSEILPAPGVELVGPLPAEVQNYISMSAGVGVKARNADAGRALIKFLAGPSIVPTLKAKGMEPAR
jgi:molybdate transport system substrate-binding protein